MSQFQRKRVNDENEKSSLIRSDLNFEGSLRVRDNRYRRSTEYNERESQPLAPLRLTRARSRKDEDSRSRSSRCTFHCQS